MDHMLVIPGSYDDSISWIIRPVWENSGSTPTRNLTIYVDNLRARNIDSNTPIMDPVMDFRVPNEDFRFPTFIPPKGESSGAVDYTSNDGLRNLRDRKQEFFIWGEAKYDDAFQNWIVNLISNHSHITRYCYRIYGVQGDISNPKADLSLLYRQCPGNCTDDECYRKQGLEPAHDNITFMVNSPSMRPTPGSQ